MNADVNGSMIVGCKLAAILKKEGIEASKSDARTIALTIQHRIMRERACRSLVSARGRGD
jgi:hypothetical protein